MRNSIYRQDADEDDSALVISAPVSAAIIEPFSPRDSVQLNDFRGQDQYRIFSALIPVLPLRTFS